MLFILWGNEHILISDLSDMKITLKGIDYLKENSKMQKAKNFLINNIEFISSLIMKIL